MEKLVGFLEDFMLLLYLVVNLLLLKKKKTKIFDSLLEIPEIRDEGFGKDKTQKHGKNLRILPV